MDIVLHAFEGVFTVSLMVLAGYYLGSHHWFSDESLNLISKLITKICLPLYMIVNLTETLTHDTVIQMSSGLPVAVSSMIICFIVGQLVALSWASLLCALPISPGGGAAFWQQYFLLQTQF